MIKIITKIVVLNIIVSLFGCQNYQSIDAYLSELYLEGKLNGNVLVLKDGTTLYENSFGYTDGSRTTMLDKNYRFIIGSVYKEFPAIAIMQLQEQNRIDLNDTVSKYIHGLPQWSTQVSIKQLLQYSSGLPAVPWDQYFSKGGIVTDNHLYDVIQRTKTLEFPPGSDYLYSNNNPILLIKIVEVISGLSFVDYVQKYIFNPFTLNNIVIKNQYPYLDKTSTALPFDTDFKEDTYNIMVKNLLFTSTARDMAHWLQVVGNFEVVRKPSLKKLSEKAKIGFNIQSPLGNCDWKNDKIIEHSHHGSSGNYECVVRRFKKDGITIIILTNQKHRNVYDISDKIYKIVTKK